MARKRRTDGDGEAVGTAEPADQIDPFMQMQLDELARMTGGMVAGQSTGTESSMLVLPFTAVSLRYLFCNSGFPVGRMTELVGETGSCKSAFLYELYRWHVANGGLYKHILAEPRDSPDLRRSIVGREVKDTLIGPVQYLGQWTQATISTLNVYKTFFETSAEKMSDANRVTIDGVDSLTAVTTKKAFEKLLASGEPEPGFSPIARAITDWVRVYFTAMAPYPISFAGVNHLKAKPSPTGVPGSTIPGGDQLGYQSTFVLEFRRIKNNERSGGVGIREIEIRTRKNSLSTAGNPRRLKVEMVWSTDPETGLQTTFWDWDRATVDLLKSFDAGSKMKKDIDKIVLVEGHNLTTSTATCKQLGFKKPTPFREIGKAIAAEPEIVRELDLLFGVRWRHAWRHGVSYAQQLREAVANPLYGVGDGPQTKPVDETEPIVLPPEDGEE